MHDKHSLRRIPIPFIILFFAVSAILAWMMLLKKLPKDAGWGKNKMKASERGYYKYRTREIGNKWSKTIVQHGYNRDGRPKKGYDSYLVVDTLKNAIWIETKGKIAMQNYCELPANMKWKIYRTIHGKNEDLPPVLRFKIRGRWSGQKLPEMFCLHGFGRSEDSFSIYVKSGHISTDYGGSGYKIQKWNKKQNKPAKKKNYYKSIYVTNEEWQAYQKKYGSTDPQKENGPPENILEAGFHETLKQICQQIEIATSRQGHDLEYLTDLEIAPNNNLIKGDIRLDDDSILPWKKYRIHEDNTFRASLIKDDMWYVDSFPEIKNNIPANYEIVEFDFIMRNGKMLPEEDNKKLLEKIRKEHPRQPPVNPDWKTELGNGVGVELLGICESPSLGGKWWGPDGKYLKYKPDFGTISSSRRPAPDKKISAAFRMVWPANIDSTKIKLKSLTSDISGGGSFSIGGNFLRSRISVFEFTANKGTEQLDVRGDIGVQKQQPESVVFEGIPLTPGNNENFKIVKAETGDDEE